MHGADAQAVERIAADVASSEDLPTWAAVAVGGLLELIPTDHSHVFSELRQEPFERGFTLASPEQPARLDLDEAMARFWRQSPTSTEHVTTAGGIFRWSDLIPRDRLERLDIYQESFHPRGEDHVVKVAFPSGPLESHAFMLRRTGGDFDDREMALLWTLYPTLRATRGALRDRSRADALAAALAAHGVGVIHVRRGAAVLEFLGEAERIVRDWFGIAHGSLSAAMRAWLDEQLRHRPTEPDAPFVVERGGRSLVVRLVRATGPSDPHQLLLQEMGPTDPHAAARALGLTPREIEVLAQVARGSTNRQIAEDVFLAPATVRRHLENIFAKLQVRTRTAAVAKVFPPPL